MGTTKTRKTKAQKRAYPQYKNVRAPSGKHWCTHHQMYEPKENFNKNKSAAHGLTNRCKEGQRIYRQAYEAKYGARNKQTKTIRVPPQVHAALKAYCEKLGLTMEQEAKNALRFYMKYACTYPGCGEPRSTVIGRCQTHYHAVATSPEDEE